MVDKNVQEFAMSHFYRAFEERHYAPREVIKNLRKQYLPFIEPLAKIYVGEPVFDIGCGRGEWLELMLEMGFSPFGIDLNEGMLQECYEKKLPASQGDGIAFLRTLQNESQVIVSAFHVVEHLTFHDLQCVIQEALRVLKPGGLLIMEMPNIENLRVSSSNFYLDPTHLRPIPVTLLSFLTETFGFTRTKVLRLQEDFNLDKLTQVSLLSVLTGVSPDCAVVAQKKANQEWLQLFDEPFAKEYGITLEQLAQKYDTSISCSISRLEARIDNAWQHYYTIANSRSWKMTFPLRLAGKGARWIIRRSIVWLSLSPASRPRRIFRKLLIVLKHKVNVNPKVKRVVLNVFSRFPRLMGHLRNIDKNQVTTVPMFCIQKPELLSPRAQEIYRDINVAIEKKSAE